MAATLHKLRLNQPIMWGFTYFQRLRHDRDVVSWARAWLKTSLLRCLEIWSFGTGDVSNFSSIDQLSKRRWVAGRQSQRYFHLKVNPMFSIWSWRFLFLCIRRSRDVCEEIKANFPEGKVRRNTIAMNAPRCCFAITTWSRLLASTFYLYLRLLLFGIP